jgi:Family of unknown function (DUF6454)
VDYQDCDYVASRKMICGGIAGLTGPDGSPFELGGLALLDLTSGQILHEVPIQQHSPVSGHVVTRNPVSLERTAAGLRLSAAASCSASWRAASPTRGISSHRTSTRWGSPGSTSTGLKAVMPGASTTRFVRKLPCVAWGGCDVEMTRAVPRTPVALLPSEQAHGVPPCLCRRHRPTGPC